MGAHLMAKAAVNAAQDAGAFFYIGESALYECIFFIIVQHIDGYDFGAVNGCSGFFYIEFSCVFKDGFYFFPAFTVGAETAFDIKGERLCRRKR